MVDAANLFWIALCALVVLGMQGGFLALMTLANKPGKWTFLRMCGAAIAFWALGLGAILGAQMGGLIAGPDVVDQGMTQFVSQALGILLIGSVVCASMFPLAYLFKAVAAGASDETASSDGPLLRRSEKSGILAESYNSLVDGAIEDISSQIKDPQADAGLARALERSVWFAWHDRLTGLGNRVLMDEMSKELPADQMTSLAVVALDLDLFREVNASYGYAAGDHVLDVAARRIASRIQDGLDFAFRTGSDEFVLWIDVGVAGARLQELSETLIAELSAPISFAGKNLHIGACAGFAIALPDETALETVDRAELALDTAKSQGRNRVVEFSSKLRANLDDLQELSHEFRIGLEKGEISILLQPQVDTRTWSITSCEVLARWSHPTRGLITPDRFLPIAEELNLLGELDALVFDETLKAFEVAKKAGLQIAHLSVNVSGKRLFKQTLVTELKARDDLPKSGLAFEVLESAFLDEASEEERLDQIWALREMGIAIGVDDFGSAQASISSVLAVQPDMVKIDQRFVRGIDQNRKLRSLMHGLIKMAHSVRAYVIVEGVETQEEADCLAELGADALQGYIFGRPMTIEQVIELDTAIRTPVEPGESVAE